MKRVGFVYDKSLDIGYTYYKNNVEPIIKIGKLKRMVSQGGI